MTDFRPNQPASAADSALKSALRAMVAAKQNAVLWFGEILDRKLYRDLGYGSINQYARLELGMSDSRVGDFLHICRRLETLPAVRAGLSAGKLGYTHARELVKVADETNEQEWVDLAQRTPRRELERAVKQAKRAAAEVAQGQRSLLDAAEGGGAQVESGRSAPKPLPTAAPPVRISLEMSPTQFARYEALWEKIRKRGGVPGDAAEALLEVMARSLEASGSGAEAGRYTAEESPRGDVAGAPPVQIHIHQCPDCERATVQTGRGEREISRAELEQARCDCRIDHPGDSSVRKNHSAIPPATRRRVLARARHRCERPGCSHSRFLEIHHVVPRAQGGSNDPANLIVLCSACHAVAHRQVVGAQVVREPIAVYFGVG